MINRIATCLMVGFGVSLSVSQVFGDAITFYSSAASFQSALSQMGLKSALVDFETLPNGLPVGPDDQSRSSPQVFSLFGGTNSANFTTTGSGFVYEDFVSVSPSHSLRENNSAPIQVRLAAPVSAIGVFAIDIDNAVAAAATAVYSSSTLANVVQEFNGVGGGVNQVAFLGAIATDDSLTLPRAILTQVLYDQSNSARPEFTYLDNFIVAVVPEPSGVVLLLVAMVCSAAIRHRRERCFV